MMKSCNRRDFFKKKERKSIELMICPTGHGTQDNHQERDETRPTVQLSDLRSDSIMILDAERLGSIIAALYG